MKLETHAAARLALLVSLSPLAGAQLGDTPETSDRLGSALARGDFNVDGIEDLAIGVPGESFTVFGFPSTTYTGAGAVHLVYGNPSGLTFAVSKLLKQPASTGSVPGLGSGNAFGSALACPDYDGDGFEDLAIGIPGQKVNNFASAGAVELFFFTPPLLKIHPPVTFHQNYYGIADAAETGDTFGASLCAGDFDGDGFIDLAVGSPGESFGSVARTGAVHVIHGSPDGGVKPKSSFWVQGKGGLPDAPEINDLFGQSLAAGDLNADGFDDLAVGVPEEDLAFQGAGAVQVIYGSSVGLQAAANQFWHQDSPGIVGEAEADDDFGTALVAGDLDLDGIDDLSIGVPGDTIAGVRAGSLDVLFGGTGGLTATDNLQISQLDFSPFLEVPEQNDRFGACLEIHTDDGFTQVVVGVPGESLGSATGAGTLQAFGVGPFRQVGSGTTFTFAFSPPEKGAGLGSAVASGDYNGDGHVDYGVGVPFKDFLAKDSGEVVIILVAAAPFMEVLHQGN